MEECRGCLPGDWLGGVFLLAHCENKERFLLRPGEEPRNGAVALVSFSILVMVLSVAPFASPFRILAR